MGTGHIFQVDRFAILVQTHLTIPCVIAEAVFDTDDDPMMELEMNDPRREMH
jgi:hypothetical protein